MNIRQFFTTKFMFEINRVMIEKADKAFLVIGLVIFVLAIVMKLAARFSPTPLDKKYREKFFNVLLTIGLLEIVWYGARWENVRFFGSHFVALAILLVGLVWLGFVIKDFVKNYRKEKELWEKEQVKLKYLPK